MAEQDDMVTVPVIVNFDHSQVVGELRVRRDALPAAPNYCFAISYRVEGWSASKTPGALVNITQHELMAVSIQSDKQYAKFLAQEMERNGHG